ncbi:MAG: ribosomal-processing cysteine protease Prp [Treponema sp.]|jgi:uncharacterized protein YsxB (DUF464 family)|nr:ribosomal-processing cysteine protease Prp [Treponema sp.]
MIKVNAVVDDEGILRSCKVCGHSGAGGKGGDIVCAAVSVLMRTAFSVLNDREGLIIRGDAPEPGFLWLEVDCSAEGKDFLYAVGVFLLEGLRSVAAEYPENCEVNIGKNL